MTSDGLKIKVDEELGLPKDKWLSMVLELACALGVSSEFPNSHKLFQRWTCLDLTEKTLANQVEKRGNQLQEQEFNCSKKSEAKPQPESLNKSKELGSTSTAITKDISVANCNSEFLSIK